MASKPSDAVAKCKAAIDALAELRIANRDLGDRVLRSLNTQLYYFGLGLASEPLAQALASITYPEF